MEKHQSIEASHCSQASPQTKILCGSGWRWQKYCHNRRHLQVCPAPGHASLNGELPLCVDKTLVQNKVTAKEAESDQPTNLIMLPDIPIPGATHAPGTGSGEHYRTICHPKWQTSSSTKQAWPVDLYSYWWLSPTWHHTWQRLLTTIFVPLQR